MMFHLAASYLIVDGRKPAAVSTSMCQADVIEAGKARLLDCARVHASVAAQQLLDLCDELTHSEPSERGVAGKALKTLRGLQLKLHVSPKSIILRG